MIAKEILRNADVIQNSDGTTSFLPSKWIFMGALAVIAILGVYLAIVMSAKKKEKVNVEK